MNQEAAHTVLLVCESESLTAEILGRLFEAGVNVVGPVHSASMALAMAAQAAPTMAIVASPPSGRRKASELAHDLMRTWGIRSLVFDEAADVEAREAQEWDAPHEQIAHIRRALEGAGRLGAAA
jgi:hypothetical protein